MPAREAMALFLAMLLEVLTWLLAGAVVLGLGVSGWRLLGLGHAEDEEHAGAGGSGGEVPSAWGREGLLAWEEEDEGPAFPEASAAGRVWRAWWLGLAVLVGLLQAWHMALPVNVWCLLVVTALGGAGCWWCRGELSWAWDEAVETPGFRGMLIAWAVVGVWLANRAAGSAHGAATGLVWYPIVSWYDAYPAVPGVGNVHPAYGFSSGWLLVSAWLSEGPWRGRVGHVGGGWVLWWMSAAAVWGVATLLESAKSEVRSAKSQGPRRGSNTGRAAGHDASSRACSPLVIFHATMAVPVLVLALGAGVSEPWAGVASSCLVLVAAGAVLGVVGPEELHRGRRIDALIVAMLLCVAGCVVDPLAWPGCVAVALAAGWRLMKSERAWVEGRRSTRSIGIGHEHLPGLSARSASVSALLLVSASLLLLWVARNVVLTGYPLYPVAAAGLPVDWRVPARQASWSAWMPRAEWGALLGGSLGLVLLPAALGVVGMFAWLARGGGEGRWKAAAGLGAALALGVVGWLVFAGRGVSGAGSAWALAALALALNSRTIARRGRPAKGPRGTQLVAVLAAAAVLAGGVHVALGAGRGLWPVSSGSRENGQRMVVTDDGTVDGWSGLPVRWPWSSDAGLAPRRSTITQAWFSRWGVEVTLTGSDSAWSDGGGNEIALASQRLAGISDDPEVIWMGSSLDEQDGAGVSPAQPLGGDDWPWALAQPSASQAPSEHLRYRAGEAGGVRHGFVIDRRGAGSLLDSQGEEVRQAEIVRENKVFLGNGP